MKTTINEKEIKVYGRQEIGAVFTAKVNEFLAQGYVFNLAENSRGSQGEEMKVCLTNDGGKTVYVIYLEKKYEFKGADTMKLQVRRYRDADDRCTLWLNKGEEVYTKVFFEIGRRNDAYVEDFADWKAIDEKQHERWQNRNAARTAKEETVLPKSTWKIAFNMLKQRKGHKTEKMANVEKVVRKNGSVYVYIPMKGYLSVR